MVALFDNLASIVNAIPPQSVLNAMSHLLTVFSEIAQTVAFPFGSADLSFHSSGDPVTKDPHFGTFAHKGIAESYYMEENYAAAMEHFELSNDKEGVSKAFTELRNAVIRKNMR